MPPGAHVGAAGQTVLGVPLEQGERVIWFDKPTYLRDRLILFVVGGVLLFYLIGIIFIVLGILWPRWQTRGFVVTNRRVIIVDKNGVPTWVSLGDIANLDLERKRGDEGGGGLAGVLLGNEVLAEMERLPPGLSQKERGDAIVRLALHAGRKAMRIPGYWKSATVVLIARSGARVRVPTGRAEELGPLLMGACENPAVIERLPAVAFEA